MTVLPSLPSNESSAAAASPTGKLWPPGRPIHVGESGRKRGLEGSGEQRYPESEKPGPECGAGKRKPGAAKRFHFAYAV